MKRHQARKAGFGQLTYCSGCGKTTSRQHKCELSPSYDPDTWIPCPCCGIFSPDLRQHWRRRKPNSICARIESGEIKVPGLPLGDIPTDPSELPTRNRKGDTKAGKRAAVVSDEPSLDDDDVSSSESDDDIEGTERSPRPKRKRTSAAYLEDISDD